LSENSIEKNISQIHLIAPAVFDSQAELLGSFNFDKSLENYKNFENITNFYFSKDDEIVTFENCEHLQKVLPNAQFHIFKNM
jgi:predicted alpha/beta hydrolase family esterase